MLLDFCSFLTGVPNGSSGHSREGPHCVPVGEPALWISQNRLTSQTSGESPYFLSLGLKYFYLKYNRFNENLSSVLQHRCVAIFKDKQNKPTGFALGSIEGRVAIHYINPPNPWVSAPNRMIRLHWYDFFTPKSPCQGMLLIEFFVPTQRQRQFYLQVPPVQWNQHNHSTRHLRCRFTSSFFFIRATLLNI